MRPYQHNRPLSIRRRLVQSHLLVRDYIALEGLVQVFKNLPAPALAHALHAEAGLVALFSVHEAVADERLHLTAALLLEPL